jgi:transcriptional regulator with XRE-family HTH domain
MAISPRELSDRTGIHRVYAWQLLKGTRKPSLELALQIYDQTGVQLGLLEELTPDDIQVMRKAAA